jgi:hypothetical protein
MPSITPRKLLPPAKPISLAAQLAAKKQSAKPAAEQPKQHVTLEESGMSAIASSLTGRIHTVEQLLAATKVDLAVWEVERSVVNAWGVAMKEVLKGGKVRVIHEPLIQVKAWLRRKAPLIVATESVLARIEAAAPILKLPSVRRRKFPHRRSLELCIMDPHIGLLCQQPEADAPWDLDLAAAHIMASIDDLVAKTAGFGPFEEVFLPFGNDFTHADNVFHTTTAGTGQPEAIAWHHVYVRAEGIAIEMVERVRQIAKRVHIYEVPGNHSRMADFTLARLLKAYFRHDPGVQVDASSSPYKFHRFGTNLIGYEHGHSVAQIRLAALMANERGRDFAECTHREWHLGDQHRKGSARPAALEEQGVSVEFIPGLTAPNEWHRLKAFNHQRRGAVAWAYDFSTGPIARVQHNLGRFTRQNLAA